MMTTLKDIRAMSLEDANKLNFEVLEAIEDNNLSRLKEILKKYPAHIFCYEPIFKNEKYPLFEPLNLILGAAYTCEANDNDFAILDYLFDEYGLSLKDPKYNVSHSNMKHIKELNDRYILIKEIEDKKLASNALIYAYLLESQKPKSKIVRYLVARGARFEIYNHKGEGWIDETPLHEWARGSSPHLLKVAIKGGANVDMQRLGTRGNGTQYNDTLLTNSVRQLVWRMPSGRDDVRVTKLLIKLGANVNWATPYTPLDEAQGARTKKILKDAGAMTSAQICEKFNLPQYDDSHCRINGKVDGKLLNKYLDERARLINEALQKAREMGKIS